jgi:hypothetical protein
VAVRFCVDCRLAPLRLERTMRLRRGERALVLDERVINTGAMAARFVWGHHCVLGAPLVAAGAELRVPCRTIVTPPQPWEGSARLEPGQRSAWPMARLRDGGEVDLSRVPGPEAASHDDAYLTGLSAGWAEVSNPELRMAFRLEFDPLYCGRCPARLARPGDLLDGEAAVDDQALPGHPGAVVRQ